MRNDELSLVESFVERARDLPHDSKAQSLVQRGSADSGEARGSPEGGHLHGIVDDPELSAGSAAARPPDYDRRHHALSRRQRLGRGSESTGALEARSGAGDPALDFGRRRTSRYDWRWCTSSARGRRYSSRSEAGAKGLNLQFCDTLINYDLPWNPQRIEQRIGRCHRYGQKRDVTVINFLAKDNEAQRLTFEILSTKLDLFGKVLDSSDVVLQTPRSDASEALASSLGPEFEAEIRRIWDRARSIGEVEEELRRLRDSLEAKRLELERVRERTVGLIESNLDASVREVFRQIKSELPAALAELDRDLERVLTGYLDAAGVPWGAADRQGTRVIHIGASQILPAGFTGGLSVVVGRGHDLADVEPLHLAHPLIEAAVHEARRKGAGSFRVRFALDDQASPRLRALRGAQGSTRADQGRAPLLRT